MSQSNLNGDGRGASIPGVASGIVTDNEDPEGLGRVKVTFPWRDADDESVWARVATEMAGEEYGTYFLPEVGDEVLVAFEAGDIHKPYVIGSLWSGKTKPPLSNGGNNDVREVKSRSGHTIDLDDTSGSEKVTIETQGGHKITLDDSGGSEKVTIEDKSGSNKVEMDSTAGEVSIEGGQKISLKAPTVEINADAKVSVASKGTAEVSGDGKLDLSSKGQLNVKSNGLMGINATGPLTIKGAIIQLN